MADRHARDGKAALDPLGTMPETIDRTAGRSDLVDAQGERPVLAERALIARGSRGDVAERLVVEWVRAAYATWIAPANVLGLLT